jgi:hypothetical protein
VRDRHRIRGAQLRSRDGGSTHFDYDEIGGMTAVELPAGPAPDPDRLVRAKFRALRQRRKCKKGRPLGQPSSIEQF